MLPPNIITLVLVATLGFTLTIFNASAQSYKWIDASGKTHYTDSPPPGGTDHKQIDLGECESDECRKELQQAQDEAARQIQETENWLRKRDSERGHQQEESQKPKDKPSMPPTKPGFMGH